MTERKAPIVIVAYGPAGLLHKAKLQGYDGCCTASEFLGLELSGAKVQWSFYDEALDALPVSVSVREADGKPFVVEEHGMLDRKALDEAAGWSEVRAQQELIILGGQALSSSKNKGDTEYAISITPRERRIL